MASAARPRAWVAASASASGSGPDAWPASGRGCRHRPLPRPWRRSRRQRLRRAQRASGGSLPARLLLFLLLLREPRRGRERILGPVARDVDPRAVRDRGVEGTTAERPKLAATARAEGVRALLRERR